MGEVTRATVVESLVADNPRAPLADVVMYADAYLSYVEAQENIDRNGNIVAHPRTGAPIENPYVKIRASAAAELRKLSRVRNVTSLWGR